MWRPWCLLVGHVTCALPDSGSPLMDGSSCLPVMTRLSSCGTRPAGSVFTRTASMAGESPGHPPPVGTYEKSGPGHEEAPAVSSGGGGGAGSRISAAPCLLSLHLSCDWKVRLHPHSHTRGVC